MSTKRLPPGELRTRLAFDHKVLQRMEGPALGVTAFLTAADAHRGANPVSRPSEAKPARCFVVELRVPTLVGPDRFSPSTHLRIDAGGDGFPFKAPVVWHHSGKLPWNSHFAKGAPACTGINSWSAAGTTLIGHLVIHLARLLNWDEPARGALYPGYNRQAAEYHQKRFGLDNPLDPNVVYPLLPAELLHGDAAPIEEQPSRFRPSAASVTPNRAPSGRRFAAASPATTPSSSRFRGVGQ